MTEVSCILFKGEGFTIAYIAEYILRLATIATHCALTNVEEGNEVWYLRLSLGNLHSFIAGDVFHNQRLFEGFLLNQDAIAFADFYRWLLSDSYIVCQRRQGRRSRCNPPRQSRRFLALCFQPRFQSRVRNHLAMFTFHLLFHGYYHPGKYENRQNISVKDFLTRKR